MNEFISEDDLDSFHGWLKYQAVDPTMLSPNELEMWKGYFEEAQARRLATPKVGRMKLARPGQLFYGVAVRDEGLWLSLWIKRTADQLFIFYPGRDKEWAPHASYHRNGCFHQKSYVVASMSSCRQPLGKNFKGTEHLGSYGGHSPKNIGAVCDLNEFTGVVEVAPGILGPSSGAVTVDLVEPGCCPLDNFREVVQRQIFREAVPWLVITVDRSR